MGTDPPHVGDTAPTCEPTESVAPSSPTSIATNTMDILQAAYRLSHKHSSIPTHVTATPQAENSQPVGPSHSGSTGMDSHSLPVDPRTLVHQLRQWCIGIERSLGDTDQGSDLSTPPGFVGRPAAPSAGNPRGASTARRAVRRRGRG